VTGMHIGLLMQLFWISTLPVGAVTIPDGNLGAIAAAIIAVRNVGIQPEFNSLIILISVVIGLLLSFVGAHALNTVRTGNVFILNQLLDKIDNFKMNYVGIAITWSIIFNFIVLFMVILIGSLIGSALIDVVLSFNPGNWLKYTRFSDIVLLGSGAGLTFTLVKGKKSKLSVVALVIFTLIILMLL
ncbi:MAG: PTS sugar transporter subunit IIC, partial [Calditrichaceae bacterium]